VLLSVLATGGLRQFGAAFEHVMEDRYANIRAVAALSDDVGVVVLAVRNFVLLNDPAKRAQELTTLKDTRQAIDDDYKALAARIQDEDGRQRLAALQARGEEFLKALDACWRSPPRTTAPRRPKSGAGRTAEGAARLHGGIGQLHPRAGKGHGSRGR
jgi:hypothetical protein